ncbi:hypothetical protein [Levilactobacillus angrenensis]|uniref:hypothetical protein n=1 Tax=Levilactobacillus angrenensis TaxID=2486020 RepID=UPI00177D2BD9|nr:hypothetical protein [Levilactobacillus angrenensis]
MIKIYRKTATITAEQLTQDNFDQLKAKYGIKWNEDYECYQLEEKYMIFDFGDWIATGTDGEHWPIADEVFKKTYAELPVITRWAAQEIEDRREDGIADLFYSSLEVAGSPGMEFIRNHPEVAARAWLDGYQIGEEDK